MPNPTITPSTDNSVYTRTELDGSSQITLAPDPLGTSFLGDTSNWQVNGDSWTVSGDKVTMANKDSGNNFLSLIYGIQQTAASPVTFRLMAQGQDIDATGDWGIELDLTDVGGYGGTVLGEAKASFHAGTWPHLRLFRNHIEFVTWIRLYPSRRDGWWGWQFGFP